MYWYTDFSNLFAVSIRNKKYNRVKTKTGNKSTYMEMIDDYVVHL